MRPFERPARQHAGQVQPAVGRAVEVPAGVHGITSLFAAFNIADGAVISELHRRHRAIEFRQLRLPESR